MKKVSNALNPISLSIVGSFSLYSAFRSECLRRFACRQKTVCLNMFGLNFDTFAFSKRANDNSMKKMQVGSKLTNMLDYSAYISQESFLLSHLPFSSAIGSGVGGTICFIPCCFVTKLVFDKIFV